MNKMGEFDDPAIVFWKRVLWVVFWISAIIAFADVFQRYGFGIAFFALVIAVGIAWIWVAVNNMRE